MNERKPINWGLIIIDILLVLCLVVVWFPELRAPDINKDIPLLGLLICLLVRAAVPAIRRELKGHVNDE